MEKKLTEKQQQFLDQAMAHRKEKVEGLISKVLVSALEKDLIMWDLPYYIPQRVREVITEAYKATSFRNEKVIKARMDFLKVCLEEMKKNVKSLPVFPKEHVKDETETRDEQEEPMVQEIVKMLLDGDLVFSDEHYFDVVLADDEGIPLQASVFGYLAALEDRLLVAISNSSRKADDKVWGCDKESVRMKLVDEVLKRP